MKPETRQTILVIDGNNLAWRKSVYGDLRTATGISTTVIFCILSGMLSYIKRFDAYNTVLCWDTTKSRRRLRLFPSYKANRKREYTEEEQVEYNEFIKQINISRKLLDFLKIPQLSIDHMEADDAISLLSGILAKKYEVIIVSTDKDLLQCVSFNVSVFNPFTKVLFTADNFIEKTGLSPMQYLFARALMGDKSDGINGIRGVGEVTAYEMVKALRVPNLQFLRQFLSTNEKRNAVLQRVETESDTVERNLKLMTLPSSFTELDEEECELVKNKMDKNFLRSVIVSKKQISDEMFGKLIGRLELFNVLNIKTLRLFGIELV